MFRRTHTAVILTLLLFAIPSLGAEPGKPPKISGIVVDEFGKPLLGVICSISGIEQWRDGKWQVVFVTGLPREFRTDERGWFEIEFYGKVRYDLQFERAGYAPAFVFQVAPDSPPFNVQMEKGQIVQGRIEIVGKESPDFAAIMVCLRLPNSRGLWFQKSTLLGHDGRFQFRVSPPPQVPGQDTRPKWQLVCAGEIVQLDVEKGKPVDEVVFEITTKSRTRPAKTIKQ